jgi:replicative DNA helicase
MDEIDSGSKERPFGPNEEKVIVSLAFVAPEFYSSVGQHLDPQYFHVPEVRFVFSILDSLFQKHEVVPTREAVRDAAIKVLTVDDDYQSILEIIGYEPDPREIPLIKETILDWARDKAYGQLYDDEAIDAYQRGDYERLSEIMENAQRIVDVSQAGEDFFDTYDKIFDVETEVKLTTGFTELDRVINEGGPTKGDVFVWMAPTGVGKSIMLINSGAACYRAGLKVLHVTLEISTHKTKLRYGGVFSRVPIRQRFAERDRMSKAIEKEKASHTGSIIIYEFPPEEISVDTIYQVIKWLKRTKGWAPDVVIIDYLELMMSRRSHYNKDDYVRQKRVSTEVRGLAKNESVLVITATQTNRELKKDKEGGGGVIDVNRIAESYGKSMPMDYLVSLNQTPDEYTQNRLRFYVAKNRNGPRHKTISVKVDYETMIVEVDQYRIL